MNDLALDGVQCRSARESCHLYKSEAMVGETGFPLLLAIPLQDVSVSNFRRADIVQKQRSVFLQGLRKPKRNLVSLVSFHLQFNPAHHVLTHVENKFPGSCFLDRNRRDLIHDFHAFVGLGHQFFTGFPYQFGILPDAVIETRLAPILQLLTGIVIFTVVFIVFADWTICRKFPRFIRKNGLCGSVLKLDFYLADQLWKSKRPDLVFSGPRGEEPTIA